MPAPADPRHAFGGVPLDHWSIPIQDAQLLAGQPPGTFSHSPVIGPATTLRRIGYRDYVHPSDVTFREFLIGFVVEQFGGLEWLQREFPLPIAERHVVSGWYSRTVASINEAQRVAQASPGDEIRIPASGYMSELLALAYDLALLIDRHCLPVPLLERLRVRTEYQGARFEMAVAAISVRAGFRVNFIKDTTKTGPEFIAEDPITATSFGVEAKSRHREGVLHRPGQLDPKKAARADVDRLITEALAKDRRGLPYVVMIDVNAPIEPGKTSLEQAWFVDAWRKLGPHSN
ncbi:MAG: hypothetical protein Q7W02_19760 [Candidatus Rokubacteria bacterium]|nr:hypothetical protein [Candidatus Rokubacteria bacterium]